ncbi:class I SAM-dependent methyltransferase [Phaeacidiphilus oryzae]|uniref:class I SAM-dependent methyltransferase n=1 Tax=Phaeacidiphilus oryzae TaxID=348818 RepID=UPI000A54FED1|nr:class I SAM-dependent methyltransferase [Phaeacidiphilus oryzae]
MSALELLRIRLLEQAWFTTGLLPLLPRRLRWGLRRAYLAPVDLADRFLGRRDDSLPNKADTYTGGVRDFAASGETLRDALREVAGLTPSSHVLDVGCGMGRLAIPMAGYLDAEGGYEGLDIVPDGISWCTANVRAPHGNVRFTLADVHNKEYHPEGRVPAREYRFPYPDDTFDVAVLISVFTHMLPEEVDNYLGELARVLKPGGRCFASYHLLPPPEVIARAKAPVQRSFRYAMGPARVSSRKVPELAVAYQEQYVRDLYRAHGFEDEMLLSRGLWSGCGFTPLWPHDSGLAGQDTLVATVRAKGPVRNGVDAGRAEAGRAEVGRAEAGRAEAS